MGRRLSGSAAEEDGQAGIALPHVGQNWSPGSVGGHSNEGRSNSTSKIHQSAAYLPTHSSAPQEIDGGRSIRPSTARSRLANNENWKPVEPRHGNLEKPRFAEPAVITVTSKELAVAGRMSDDTRSSSRRPRLRSPWSCSPLTLLTTLVSIVGLASILHSFINRQRDTKGCRMSYMRPSFAKLSDFDTEHTRFASKYSTYLYREGMIDEDTKVCG